MSIAFYIISIDYDINPALFFKKVKLITFTIVIFVTGKAISISATGRL